ncbi:hypothetical protein [Pseudoxanthomonas sp.]|jgi:hypothetical protein|uniref:hypothetical protein n=1 Tax=Pseudoxanthomonas sp. TaxID=1871049 RepID=UPI002E14EC36|nr:hypothetical protein [Pseudoxanthomonas sp.]
MNPPALSPVAPWTRVLRPLSWGGALALLALPWVAMRFTDEIAWTGRDFALFGAMLLVACLAFEAVVRVARAPAYLVASLLAIGTAFLLVWASLAVGIVDEPEHPANLMFAAVLLVGAIGAALSRLQARGMAQVLSLMSCLQVAAGAIAISMDTQTPALFMLVLTLVCTAAWLASAWLYHVAARPHPGEER